ncbi:hypothetical protein TSTA_099880 [Paecilomyces variotii No. 5]|uniref:Uncharacterized protein n=1 Tax=Byssochlamys spectabilis (strain No. 5 / NBRC 109023) TaxID=1356009 RepID=V5FRQ5_BYSSN|nr:hypothetical protein TSTA_099880 [Paecilomyces variotii No. 5]
MKAFAISCLLFCSLPLSLGAPISHGQFVRARHTAEHDSTTPSLNLQNTALTGLRNGGTLDKLVDKHGRDGYEAVGSFVASWQKLLTGRTANYELATGHMETLQSLMDYFLHGRKESPNKHYRHPSPTAETHLPTTELMRLSAEHEQAKSPPLPSSPTIVPSWVEALQHGEKDESEGITKSQLPTATVDVHFPPPHGFFVKKKLLPHVPKTTRPPVTTKAGLNEAVSTLTSNISLDYSVLLERFGPEITVLSVFILVPISVLIVEAIEIVWRRWAPERFPRRGRGRLRLTGEERRLQAWSDWEREKILSEKSRRWWKRSRRNMGRKHACNFSN